MLDKFCIYYLSLCFHVLSGFHDLVTESISSLQFYYGEDGMEVNKTPFLQSKQLPFLLQNKDVICARKDLTLELKAVRKTKKKVTDEYFNTVYSLKK